MEVKKGRTVAVVVPCYLMGVRTLTLTMTLSISRTMLQLMVQVYRRLTSVIPL